MKQKRRGRQFCLFFLLILTVACGADDASETLEEQPVAVLQVPLPAATASLPPPVVNESGGQESVQSETDGTDSDASGPTMPWSRDDFGYGIQVHGNATVGDAHPTEFSDESLASDATETTLFRWETCRHEPRRDIG